MSKENKDEIVVYYEPDYHCWVSRHQDSQIVCTGSTKEQALKRIKTYIKEYKAKLKSSGVLVMLNYDELKRILRYTDTSSKYQSKQYKELSKNLRSKCLKAIRSME